MAENRIADNILNYLLLQMDTAQTIFSQYEPPQLVEKAVLQLKTKLSALKAIPHQEGRDIVPSDLVEVDVQGEPHVSARPNQVHSLSRYERVKSSKRAPQLRCKQCSISKNKRKNTTKCCYGCNAVQPPGLCSDECFKVYHQTMVPSFQNVEQGPTSSEEGSSGEIIGSSQQPSSSSCFHLSTMRRRQRISSSSGNEDDENSHMRTTRSSKCHKKSA